MAGISIVHHNLQVNNTYDMFTITVFSDTVQTIVTSTPSVLHSWIQETTYLHRNLAHTIVGLDIEWRPNFHRNQDNPTATLQLCVSGRCLIFQFLYAPSIPQILGDFLADSNFTFVGVQISGDVQKLVEDYGLVVRKFVDLGHRASIMLGNAQLSSAGLKTLAWEVLGLDVLKPKKVTKSRWDVECLSLDQIQYACVDAFLSLQIGRRLLLV